LRGGHFVRDYQKKPIELADELSKSQLSKQKCELSLDVGIVARFFKSLGLNLCRFVSAFAFACSVCALFGYPEFRGVAFEASAFGGEFSTTAARSRCSVGSVLSDWIISCERACSLFSNDCPAVFNARRDIGLDAKRPSLPDW